MQSVEYTVRAPILELSLSIGGHRNGESVLFREPVDAEPGFERLGIHLSTNRARWVRGRRMPRFHVGTPTRQHSVGA